MTEAIAGKVGVEAVVEGLKAFEAGFNKMNNLIDGFGKKADSMGRKVSPVSKVLDAFGESLRRIGEFVVAGIILRGIDAIANAIRNMIGVIYEAASAFQGLVVRLENFIAADLMAAGQATDFNDALMQAGPLAEDLFFWLQKLALVTPFDTQDVADAFTMAKAWGFNTEEAKKLTQQVIDFTAGMGLEGEAMDRVIKALGQMKSLGRVAGQELLQLANAGVPVADIMENIRLELGLTTDEFEKLRMKGGISADMFFAQWDKLVNQRFAGSAQRMSRTMSGVLGNLRDLVEGVLGFNVLRPVLDVISGKLADFMDILTTGTRGDQLLNITKQIGENLAGIVQVFVGGLPDAESAADGLLGILAKISGKLTEIRLILEGPGGGKQKAFDIMAVLGFDPDTIAKVDEIITKVTNAIGKFKEGDITGGLGELGVPQPIINFVEGIIGVFDRLAAWWDENKERVMGALGDIGSGLGMGAEEVGESALDIILRALESFADFLEEHGEEIVSGLEDIGKAMKDDFGPAMDKLGTFVEEHGDKVLLFLLGFAAGWKAIGLIAGIIALVAGLLFLFTNPIFLIIAIIPIIIGILIAFGKNMWEALQWAAEKAKEKLGEIADRFRKLKEQLGTIKDLIIARIKGVGKSIVDGLKEGIREKWDGFLSWIREKLSGLPQVIKDFFGIESPSKMFAGFGASLMEGLAQGIQGAMQLPESVMQVAVNHVVQPVSSAVSGGGTTVNNNFSMTVNTQAKTSTVAADFRTLQSMAGA